MSLVLRGITPDPMGWALGQAIHTQLMTHYLEPGAWAEAHPNDRLWHARRAQWLLDHTTHGPGQWPTPDDLARAEAEWFAEEHPTVCDPWDARGPEQQAADIEHATTVLNTAQHRTTT